MDRESVAQMARQFPENGMKRLLENPNNVRDLLALTGSDLAARIDTDQMRLLPTTFIRSDYRHVESDVVLQAPFKAGSGGGPDLLIYVLIEHQSTADRMMPLRLLEYVVQIYSQQSRQSGKKHRSFAHFRAQPVLPIVFYTGTERWESVGQLSDLVAGGERFEAVTPVLEPLFINLPDMDAKLLEQTGGFLGRVLRLVQQRKSQPDAFRTLLADVVGHLETMPEKERLRWLQLLSYVMALVYHERGPTERPRLRETVEMSVSTDDLRQELSQMGKTIAEELIEKGKREGERDGRRDGKREGEREGRREGRREGERAAEISARQCTLIRQLEKRFGEIPSNVLATINATDNVQQLDDWLDQFVTAECLEDFAFEQGK